MSVSLDLHDKELLVVCITTNNCTIQVNDKTKVKIDWCIGVGQMHEQFVPLLAVRGSTGNSKSQYRPAFLDHFEQKEQQQSGGGKPTNNSSQPVQQGAPPAPTQPRQDISQVGGGGCLQSFQRSFIEGDFDFVSSDGWYLVSDIINKWCWSWSLGSHHFGFTKFVVGL